ncbi:MAG: flagellar biosynthesis protein FliQ [bacterium]|nr:flagellar biosynthesis protein FliQ [bacterium]
MGESAFLEIGQQGLQIALLVAAPLLMASLIVGILISLVQVATSLQDATLTFVPKILAVGLTLLLIGHWMMRVLVDYTNRILTILPGIIG